MTRTSRDDSDKRAAAAEKRTRELDCVETEDWAHGRGKDCAETEEWAHCVGSPSGEGRTASRPRSGLTVSGVRREREGLRRDRGVGSLCRESVRRGKDCVETEERAHCVGSPSGEGRTASRPRSGLTVSGVRREREGLRRDRGVGSRSSHASSPGPFVRPETKSDSPWHASCCASPLSGAGCVGGGSSRTSESARGRGCSHTRPRAHTSRSREPSKEGEPGSRPRRRRHSGQAGGPSELSYHGPAGT
jgi:hypothetical protein